MSEACARCGEVGEDRRTLQMACFYDLSELGIPFNADIVFHGDVEQLRPSQERKELPLPGPGNRKITVHPGKYTTEAELTPQPVYTIRVCKECRADWMSALEIWWNTRYGAGPRRTGTGVFVRRGGTNYELDEEEIEQWKAEHGGEEPVRIPVDEDIEQE